MLIICWLVCGPSVKRENGAETEMPGCKIKFELSNRKKIRRKTTFISAKRTSQPKLYSFVRPSFMRGCSICRSTECRSRIGTCLRLGRLLRSLETDDTADRSTLRQHMEDLNAGAFHGALQARAAAGQAATRATTCRGPDHPHRRGQH